MAHPPLAQLIPDVREAGRIATDYHRGVFTVETKSDCSPVTEADLAVDDILARALAREFPTVAVVSEERVAEAENLDPAAPFFLVDPIDGTKEFIAGNEDFTINIALIEDGVPVAGIVHAPAKGRLFIAESGGKAEEMNDDGDMVDIRVRDCSGAEIVAAASRSHDTPATQDFLRKQAIAKCVTAGSSLKFCLLASGQVDIYPRFGPTMEWDTAAGHAVLRAAGGGVITQGGAPLTYGKPGFRNPDFIAASPTALARVQAKAAASQDPT